MADIPSIETQIDCFLEQFKRSASKAMEEQMGVFGATAVSRSRSSYLDGDMPDDPEAGEEIEMNCTAQTEALDVNQVADLLHPQYAIITGGKSKDGCPIITFPDHNNFHSLCDKEYQQLMLYLTSVPSLQEADMGFHLIIDRRTDRWNSVKTVLLKISVYFPGLVHVVYVIRPASFLQKALSEVSNKLFKEEFKFRTVVISSVDELHEYIDASQLTEDLGGTLPYVHHEWIQQRISLEKFSELTHEISNSLSKFTKSINDTEFPNNVDSTQQLLNQQTARYSELKEEILAAAKHGEIILSAIKCKTAPNSDTAHIIGNVFAIERLLVQLEETERTFDDFWQKHSTALRCCLDLRRFEQDFRQLQTNFDSHIKTVTEMTETAETVQRNETLVRETAAFEKLCVVDIERAEEVVATGTHLLKIKNSCPSECVEPKCKELDRMKTILVNKLAQRMQSLVERKDVLEVIEKADKWCAIGAEILARSNSPDEDSLNEIQRFLLMESCGNVLRGFVTSETKDSVAQVLQKIEDVSRMCEKRLTQLTSRPVQVVPAVPRQPSGGAPHPNRANSLPRMESSPANNNGTSPETDVAQDEANKIKRGHVLTELLETERIYVTELSSIIAGYKLEALKEDMQPLVPPGFLDKLDVVFGNLEEIYSFHAHMFLKDLETCILSTDLVALCFVQKRETFFKLYSFYCQNISRSEQLRESMSDSNAFFQACQRKLGHKLPLAAYLLKPVQRITKYQLLLKDLLRFSHHRELQQALDCMLVVLKCVNDSMHQISIVNFPVEIKQQGELLLQGSFSVWVENKRDLRLRLKPMRRHIFLYQKAMLFCKPATKSTHNKATYCFKHYLKMSQIGLTETVKGDARKFEVWLEGRQEVYTIQAANVEVKTAWVNEVKRVLLNQLEELKGEKIKQYSALAQKPYHQRSVISDDDEETGNWSSDCSISDDEDQHPISAVPSARYIALADYCAVSNSEVNMREGEMVELLKVGCAGWWFVRVVGTLVEGWAPAAYLENLHRKTSRSTSHSQDRLNLHAM